VTPYGRFRLTLIVFAAINLLCGLALGWLTPVSLGWSLLPTSLLVLGVLFAVAACLPEPWHVRLGSSLFSLLFVVLMLEVLIASLAPSAALSTIYQLDPVSHYRLIPGSSRYYRHSDENGGGRVLVSVNSHGYRGAELAPRGDAMRIAVLGDSFIAAEFSEEDATFAARLAQHIAELVGRNVESVNVGVAGYGPDQIAVRLREDLLTIQPDVAVLGVYSGNDFGDLVRNQLLRIDSRGVLEQSESQVSDSIRRDFWTARYEPRSLKILSRLVLGFWHRLEWKVRGWFGATPEAYDFVEESLGRVQSEYRTHVKEGDQVARSLLGDPYDADLAAEPSSESAGYKRLLMELVLARAQETAKSAGVPIVLVIIPSPIDTCDGYRLGSVDPVRHPEYDRANLTQALVSSAQAQQMPYVDLFDTFRAQPEGDLFLRGLENHWNDEGQDLAAREVAQFLVSSGLLKQR
jgi:hypothetical protein